MYGSPLSIMRLVIKTKSVEFMPFFLSLFVFLCGTSWFIFGLIGHDPFVAVPNGIGSILGTMQLILYFIYRDKKCVPRKQAKTRRNPWRRDMQNLIKRSNPMQMELKHENCLIKLKSIVKRLKTQNQSYLPSTYNESKHLYVLVCSYFSSINVFNLRYC
uniref:Bidirectional sugar transporter SWEET n=1 Tax=Lotus japonicus TaxID=34305 RepID=I3S2L6_LOTJA|nr:unknown [Lotus japonicus]